MGNVNFNFSVKSKAGCTANKYLKTNQDASITCPKMLLDVNLIFFAVADGHGVNGHLVSDYIKKNLPKNILRFYKSDSEVTWSNIIKKSFQTTNYELGIGDFDCNLSGSTLISVLINNGKLYCANVGDSRAIIGRYDKG